MAAWPENPRLIGTKVPRLDGMAKATGAAKYPSDVHPDGMLFGVMLYSPHARARVTSIDITQARSMPGVQAIEVIAKEGTELRYQGDDIAAVAAETEEQARDAARAIRVDYEILPHVVTEEQAMADDAPPVFRGGNVRRARSRTSGDIEQALGEADAVVEATYSLPVITHVCLETHGLTAQWQGDQKLVAWSSTQAVGPTAGELAASFQVAPGDVHVITEVMGGGFGSKFGPELWGLVAARMAQATGRPVRMFLDRVQEHLAAGNRPSAIGTLKIAGTRDGQITALVADVHGTAGTGGGADVLLPYIYHVPNTEVRQSSVLINAGSARAMRAPRHPQSCTLMEAAVDDLADKLELDPLEFRLRNLSEGDRRTPTYHEQVKLGAQRIGWDRRRPRGQNGDGPIKRGLGMALHQWGGGGSRDKQVACLIHPDGSVELRSATQDIGTGTRTLMAIIAAEVLGLQPTDINSDIGDSIYPPGQSSGGSTTAPSMSPPTFNAASQARDQLFARIAPGLNAQPRDLGLKDGQVTVHGEPKLSWQHACRKLGLSPISVTAGFVDGLSDNGVGGCQFAEVTVDTETGVVRLVKIVAVQDSGLIINKMAWTSQIYGGIIGGLNYGLFEERVMDPTTGIMLNPDMEMYKLAGASDIPEIIVIPYDTPEMRQRGVIGVGEPPTVSTAAAIGNAVTNAIGTRVTEWPMSPRNVLNALERARKGEA